VTSGKLWLTYAWVDNDDLDIDHIVLKLRNTGLEVKLDRQHIIPGQRLWSQIDKAISNPEITDAWAIVATEDSLKSEPCIEELAYALDRALRTRGGKFPLIGIFPKPIDRDKIPSAIATRLYVDLRSTNWAEQVVAGVRGIAPLNPMAEVPPFVFKVYKRPVQLVLEIRPRTGRWYPCMIAIPASEYGLLGPVIAAPEGLPPSGGMTSSSEFKSQDGLWRGVKINHAIDALNSVYIHFTEWPSTVVFGGSRNQFALNKIDFVSKQPRTLI
jgi:hypothetical protein